MRPAQTGWKEPPKAKIYEALSAVADGRVTAFGERSVEVSSSDGSKSYIVEWSEDETAFASNDNGSHWQGYIGYPIIAVLLIRGKLHYDPNLAAQLAGVPWKALNTQYRQDYSKAIAHVLADLRSKAVDTGRLVSYVDELNVALAKLRIERLRSRRTPPTV